MDREKALALAASIIRSQVEAHRADLGERGVTAVEDTIADLQGLISEIYADVDAAARRSADGVAHEV